MSAQKKKTLIIVCAAVVLVAAMLAVWFAFGPKGTAGQKAIGVTVVYADATTDEFSFSTDAEFLDRKSTRLNSSHWNKSRMPSSA